MKTNTQSKPSRAHVEFQRIELYERMLVQRENDPHAYLMQHSLNERHAAEHYERAKRKSEELNRQS